MCTYTRARACFWYEAIIAIDFNEKKRRTRKTRADGIFIIFRIGELPGDILLIEENLLFVASAHHFAIARNAI